MVGDVTGGADVVDRDVVGRAAVDALAQQDEGRVVRTGGQLVGADRDGAEDEPVDAMPAHPSRTCRSRSRLPPVCSMITSQPTSAAASMMNRDSSAK